MVSERSDKEPKGCLGQFITFKTYKVLEKFEADLFPIDNPRGKRIAELEYEKHDKGAELEVEIKRASGVPVGEEVVVKINGVEACRVTMIDRLNSEVELKTERGDEVPEVRLGDRIELIHNNFVIAAGEFGLDD